MRLPINIPMRPPVLPSAFRTGCEYDAALLLDVRNRHARQPAFYTVFRGDLPNRPGEPAARSPNDPRTSVRNTPRPSHSAMRRPSPIGAANPRVLGPTCILGPATLANGEGGATSHGMSRLAGGIRGNGRPMPTPPKLAGPRDPPGRRLIHRQLRRILSNRMRRGRQADRRSPHLAIRLDCRIRWQVVILPPNSNPRRPLSPPGFKPPTISDMAPRRMLPDRKSAHVVLKSRAGPMMSRFRYIRRVDRRLFPTKLGRGGRQSRIFLLWRRMSITPSFSERRSNRRTYPTEPFPRHPPHLPIRQNSATVPTGRCPLGFGAGCFSAHYSRRK